MEEKNELMRDPARENLEVKYRRREGRDGGEEQPLTNEDIRRGIAERRRLNKIHKN